MHALHAAGVPPAPQPYAHVLDVVPLPSAAHVESIAPVHDVLLGTHTLHAAVPPLRALHPWAHVDGVVPLPSCAHVESVVASLQLVASGVHVLQCIAVGLQP
jgi:hypothetical protein